jgi:hypothetical protein
MLPLDGSTQETTASSVATSKTIIPKLDPSFIYLQGGVHFPKAQVNQPTAKQVSSPAPSKFASSLNTAFTPPVQHQKQHQSPIGQMSTQMIDKRNKEHHPLYMTEEKVPTQNSPESSARPTLLEMALDILPRDFEITSLLQSPQIQKAWFNQLTISRGPKEAALFQELIINLQKQPDLILVLKEQMVASKLLKASRPTSFSEEMNPVTSMSSTERGTLNNAHSGREKPAILAEDLEAML